jgi:hypothetical protein
MWPVTTPSACRQDDDTMAKDNLSTIEECDESETEDNPTEDRGDIPRDDSTCFDEVIIITQNLQGCTGDINNSKYRDHVQR